MSGEQGRAGPQPVGEHLRRVTSRWATSCSASSASGQPWGVNVMIGQEALPSMAPARSAGISPARTSDDLPPPELPVTARNREMVMGE